MKGWRWPSLAAGAWAFLVAGTSIITALVLYLAVGNLDASENLSGLAC